LMMPQQMSSQRCNARIALTLRHALVNEATPIGKACAGLACRLTEAKSSVAALLTLFHPANGGPPRHSVGRSDAPMAAQRYNRRHHADRCLGQGPRGF
jgi:hypothetical protein